MSRLHGKSWLFSDAVLLCGGFEKVEIRVTGLAETVYFSN